MPRLKPMMITSQRVLKAHYENSSFTLITHGPTRSGKSSHDIQVLAEVYGEHELIKDEQGQDQLICVKPKWSAWEYYLTFLPQDFIKKFQDQMNKGEPGLCIVRDDASVYASAYDWDEDFGKATSDLVAVQYTAFNSFILNTPVPKWLLKHIRDIPGVYVGRVNKPTGNPLQKDLRYLRAYEQWATPDFKKEGVKPVYEDYFSVRLPDDVYKKYNEVRKRYTQMAVNRYAEILDKMRDRGKFKQADDFARDLEMKAGIKVPY